MLSSPKRSVFSLAFPLLVGAMVGVGSLYYFSDTKEFDTPAEEFALGAENTVSLFHINGMQIHCHNLVDGHKCIDDYNKQSSRNEVVLWLGNSQLHVINQMQPDDVTAAAILHRSVATDGKYNLTFSQPNANLQEHYVLFEYLSQKLNVTTLVLPVVFDDTRETGIRNSLSDAFDSPSVSSRLRMTEIGRNIVANNVTAVHGPQNIMGSDNDTAALAGTVQKRVEKYLDGELERMWGIWEERPAFRSSLLRQLYQFRNWLFRIEPSSIRRVLPGRYLMNLQALTATLQSANDKRVEVLLYIPPIRDDVQIPYDLEYYGNFKSTIESIAEKNNARFSNLESLIPPHYWGMKASTNIKAERELDFMHFQANGHQLLADALYAELTILWAESRKDDF